MTENNFNTKNTNARYVILKTNSLYLPYIENAETIPVPGSNKSYVFVDLTASEAQKIAKLLKANGSIHKDFSIQIKEDSYEPDDESNDTLTAQAVAMESAAQAANVYLTGKKICASCNVTTPGGKPTLFIIMDQKVDVNKRNKKGQKIFAGLNIEIGPSFVDPEGPPCGNHGNSVLALYCGKNKYGMIPDCNKIVDKILAIEVFRCKNGILNFEQSVKAWLWVAEYTRQNIGKYNIVINHSVDALTILYVGTYEAIKAAVDAGAFVFFPAGNHGNDSCDYSPNLRVPGVFISGGTARGNLVAESSNWGKCVDAFFPYSVRDYNNKIIQGTSFSCPFAGVLALCTLAKNPTLNRDQLFAAITERMTTINPTRWHNQNLPTRITRNDKFCNFPVYTAKDKKKLMLNSFNSVKSVAEETKSWLRPKI